MNNDLSQYLTNSSKNPNKKPRTPEADPNRYKPSDWEIKYLPHLSSDNNPLYR